jgi:hypothetical protein
MNWFSNLNGKENDEYLMFSFVGDKYPIYQSYVDGARNFLSITKDVFKKVVTKVKDECERIARGFISELK